MLLHELFYSPQEQERTFCYLFDKNAARNQAHDSNAAIPSFKEYCENRKTFHRAIFKAIQRGDYALQPARLVEINADKRRIAAKFSWPDKFLLTHLARCINTIVAPQFADSLFSFREGKSNHLALKQVASFVAQNGATYYLARRDIANFGEEMAHRWIVADIEKIAAPTPELVALLTQICRFPYEDSDRLLYNRRGLPTGTFLQLVAENLYLRDLDAAMEAQPQSLYLRFGDDILFITPSKEVFDAATKEMSRIVSERELQFKTSKSIDAILAPPHWPRHEQGFDVLSHISYLGMIFDYRGVISIPRRKQRVYTTYLREHLTRLNTLLPRSYSAEDRVKKLAAVVRDLFSEPNWFRRDTPLRYLNDITSEEQLRALDRWLATCISSIVLKRGFKNGTFRSLPLSTLRKAGVPSMLHMRRINEL